MKYKLKCMVSTFLTLSITATSIIFSIHIKAAETTSPNIAMVETILHGKRQFVKESLLNDNFSTNPHAIVNGIGNEKSMMANSLSQYQNKNDENYSAAYKTAVDIMEKVYNGSDYTQSVADYVVEFAASLLEFFDLDASGLMSDLTQSVGEIRYESILKDALDADYTTSSGNKLSSKESELINLRRLEKGAKNLSSFTSLVKSIADNDSGSAGGEDMLDYYNNFLLPYGDTVNDVLSSFSFEQSSWDKESIEALNAFTTAIAMVQQGDRFVTSSDEVGATIVTYCPTYFLDETTLDLIDFANKGMKNASRAISSYMFIRSIQEQKDSIAEPLKRIASNTSDSSMKTVYNDFAKEITSAADSKTVQYETVIRYINQSGTVSKFVNGKISDGVEKAANLANLGTEYTAISSVFSKASNVVGISGWCADKLIGFGATCKKTYELKYLDKMITQAVNTCKNDISAYEASKTDENATKVLDDLTLIQKLRLRGETISYSMMSKQFDSPLAKLLATGTLNKDEMLDSYLDKAYQNHMDALVGASVMPMSTDGFTIGNGETLTLLHDASYGGVYGVYTKSDKSTYSIAEPQYRLANGITVSSGGKLVAATSDFYIPYIKNSGGTVLIGSNVQELSELTQSGGTTTFGDGSFKITDIEITGGTINSNSSATLNCDSLKTSGTPTVDQITLIANDAELNGTLRNCNVYVKGDLSGSGTIDNLIISGSGAQNLSGSITATNLTYTNTGTANQSSTVNVTGTVKNTSAKVNNGQNTVLKSTGTISGNYYNSSITLDGATLSDTKTIGGSVYAKNTVNINGLTVSGLLNQSGGTLNLNGDVTAKSDAYFSGTVNQENSEFYAYGDISGSNITLGNVTMCGKTPQTIGSAITVHDFHNKSEQLTVNSTVTVTGSARSESPPINGKNIKLTDSAYFGDIYYNGDITVNGLTGSLPKNLRGKLYLTGDITQSGNANMVSVEHSGGTLTITDGEIAVDGLFINSNASADVLVCSDSTLSIMGDASIKGTVQGEGILNVYGDLYNSGSISIGNLNITAKVPLTVGGNNLYATNLNISGNKDVTLSSKIYVTGKYSGNNHIINPANVVFANGNTANSDVVYNEQLNVTGDLIIDGHTVTARGLTVTNGNVILTNGAKLIVNGGTNISGASSNKISIDETSSAEFNKLSFIKSIGSIEVNGNLKFGGDISLSSTKISGSGTVTVNADIYGSSLTIDKPKNFNITGKTPQIIQCSGANLNNLNISNTSKQGVEISGTIYYYGTYSDNGCKIAGTITKR